MINYNLIDMSYNGTIEVSTSDIDFYQRKIIRLEDDINILHDELSKLRVKLRIAQDYEIKYNILLKTTQTQIQQLREELQKAQKTPRVEMSSQEQQKLKEEGESRWNRRQYELEQKWKNEADKELQMLRSERDEYQRKIHQLTLKREESDIVAIKIKKLEKENEGLQQQIEDNRVHFERKKGQEINDLRNRLNQNYKEKMANERKIYETKIHELEKKLVENEISKDHEVFSFPASSNAELIAIKKLFEESCEAHSKQKSQLEYWLQEKGRENKNLAEEKHRIEQKYQDDISNLEAQISRLEENLLQKQKQYETQLTQALHQTHELHEKQLGEKDRQIKELQAEAANQKKWWSTTLMNHDKQIEALQQKHANEIDKITGTNNELNEKINELSNRLNDNQGERAAGETQGLIQSLKDLEQRQKHMMNYEDGITFLEQQLTRAQHKLQQKTRALQTAYDEVTTIRAEAAQEASDMLEKILVLKDEHANKINGLERKVLELNDQIRQKEKQIKKIQRQKIVQESQLNIETNKWKFQLEELRKDYKRIIQSKKESDSNYRTEREKNFNSNTDISGVKKEKWLGLQRQKSQLEAIFREKEEQLRLKYEGQLQHKNSQLAQMKHQQQIAGKQNELLHQQNLKLKEQLDHNKQNTNARNYQYKLTTVNLELAFTQNIYDRLLQAKCRTAQENEEQQPSQIQGESYRMVTEPLQREDHGVSHNQSQQPMLFSAGPSTIKKPE